MPLFEDYESPIDGTPITSRQKRRNDLAASGCVEYEPGMRDDADLKVKQEEAALEKGMDDTVDELLYKMDNRSKERLINEVADGASISYERMSGE